jgi:hypothetical protein
MRTLYDRGVQRSSRCHWTIFVRIRAKQIDHCFVSGLRCLACSKQPLYCTIEQRLWPVSTLCAIQCLLYHGLVSRKLIAIVLVECGLFCCGIVGLLFLIVWLRGFRLHRRQHRLLKPWNKFWIVLTKWSKIINHKYWLKYLFYHFNNNFHSLWVC